MRDLRASRIDLTVYEMNHGLDQRDRARFLVAWNLSAGAVWLQVDGADDPEDQLQGIITNVIVGEDAANLPTATLIGGQKAYGSNEASSDAALFYPLDTSSPLHYLIIYNRNRDSWMRDGTKAGARVGFQQVPGLSLAVEVRAEAGSGGLASSTANAVASSLHLAG
jgi:hypothetical protein